MSNRFYVYEHWRKINRKMKPEYVEAMKIRVRKQMADPEMRRRLSEANKGKPLPPDRLAKLVAANKGRPLTEEHKAKIGLANKLIRLNKKDLH